MKQKKFRVWHKEFKRFLGKEEYVLDLDGKLIFVEMNIKDSDDLMVKLLAVSPKLYIIQQFTGFLDSNEKEIYEGDIVKTDENHITSLLSDSKPYSEGEVRMVDTCMKICQSGLGAIEMNHYITCNCCPCGLTIIGNIFEK